MADITKIDPTNSSVYYFLGNIVSHITHVLPLYKRLGGTVVVTSQKAKTYVEKYGVKVITIDDKPYKWMKPGLYPKPIHEYSAMDSSLKNTYEYLNKNARVVLFYDLFDIQKLEWLDRPKKIFMHHGNGLKPFFTMQDKRMSIIDKYDYVLSLGPNLKKTLLRLGLDISKLVDLGVARTDEVVRNQGKIVVSKALIEQAGASPKYPMIAYLPTFWGASSIYDTGIEIIKNWPDNYTLLFRPHPQTPNKLIQKYLRLINQKPNTVIYLPDGRFDNIGLINIFEASSAIIGDVSSVMLEAVLTKKPLIFAYGKYGNRPSDDDYEPIRNVLSASRKINLENVTTLPEILKDSLASKIDEATWQKAIEQNYYHADGTSVYAIKEFIESLL